MAITSVTRNEAAQRLHLVDGPTPLSEHPLLGERLGGIRLFFKRDDLGQIGGGGNKLRKLQLVLGKALESGADTVVTYPELGGCGRSEARVIRLHRAERCELILSRKVPRRDADYEHNGNQVLDRILGASIHGRSRRPFVTARSCPRLDCIGSKSRSGPRKTTSASRRYASWAFTASRRVRMPAAFTTSSP